MKISLFVVIAICVSLYPVASISRWFTSSYYDVRVTLRRYARCEGSLSPLRKQGLSDTEFLVNQMKVFLDQANFDNEQLANITQLMNTICRPTDTDVDYPISMNIDVTRYNSTAGKAARCKAIDRAMDSMFHVFKRASSNHSEPLDFSVIQYPSDFQSDNNKALNSESFYNLTDLINTVWISSETMLDQTCNITKSINDYVRLHTSNSTAQDRSQQQQNQGFIKSLFEIFDRLLDPILGLQKRLYWESNNRVEVIYIGIGNQLGYLRDGLGKGYKSTRDRISNIFSSGSSNSTLVSYNVTQVPSLQNTTVSAPVNVPFNKTSV